MKDFDYKELTKYIENIGLAKADFDLFLKQFLLEQAQRVVRETKLRTPVDTGTLRNSWSIGTQKVRLKETTQKSKSGNYMVEIDPEKSTVADINVINDMLEVEIYSEVEYASYVEYGHHSYQGRFMLTISINAVQEALPQRFQSAFKKYLKDRGIE